MALFFKIFISLCFLVPGLEALADSPFVGQTFNYYGKLPNNYQNQKSVTLEITFYETAQGNDVLSRAPRIFKDLNLSGGEFSVSIEMDQVEYEGVFQSRKKPAFIQIKDLGKNVSFRRLPFFPSIENHALPSLPVNEVSAQMPPTSQDFLSLARAACIGANTAGAKFVVKTADLVSPCLNACVHAESRALCIRGWTIFTGQTYFEFGDECSKGATGFQAPVESRVCCCVTTARPMPVQLEPAHH